MERAKMFASKFVTSTNGYSDRQRLAAEMLIAGVAFQKDGKMWNVFSHEGDHLGAMSTFIVSQTICMLKKAGLKLNGHYLLKGGCAHPNPPFPGAGVATFGFNTFPPGVIEEMMARRVAKPLVLT